MIWFTSDTHFGHERILDLCDRPFATVEEMNEALIANWNEVIGDTDIVIHLGDFIMGTFAENINIIDRLNGIIYLVPGNHDRMSSAYHHKNPEARIRFTNMYRDHGVIILPEFHSMEDFDLSHYPYAGDSQEDDRHVELRPIDNGRWLLHGHVHTEWARNGRMINVGTDMWNYTPVSINTIRNIIAE